MLLDFGHPELRGRGLSSALLSPDEGKELLALVEARIGGELSGRKLGRYRKLVGKAAGDPDLFDKARAEREAAEAEAAEADGSGWPRSRSAATGAEAAAICPPTCSAG